MKLYNTLSRTKEEFIPVKPNEVMMYSCGPTVYNFFHIGNARPFILFDCLRRFLEYRGYKVTFVQNFTDIDDRMIKKANEEGTSVFEVAEKYIREYYIDARGLGIKDAELNKLPKMNTTAEIINASSICASNSLANRLKGRILLQIQQHGEAYYVYPKNCRMIYLKDGAAAYEIMRYLGLGITNADLERVEVK